MTTLFNKLNNTTNYTNTNNDTNTIELDTIVEEYKANSNIVTSFYNYMHLENIHNEYSFNESSESSESILNTIINPKSFDALFEMAVVASEVGDEVTNELVKEASARGISLFDHIFTLEDSKEDSDVTDVTATDTQSSSAPGKKGFFTKVKNAMVNIGRKIWIFLASFLRKRRVTIEAEYNRVKDKITKSDDSNKSNRLNTLTKVWDKFVIGSVDKLIKKCEQNESNDIILINMTVMIQIIKLVNSGKSEDEIIKIHNTNYSGIAKDGFRDMIAEAKSIKGVPGSLDIYKQAKVNYQHYLKQLRNILVFIEKNTLKCITSLASTNVSKSEELITATEKKFESLKRNYMGYYNKHNKEAYKFENAKSLANDRIGDATQEFNK